MEKPKFTLTRKNRIITYVPGTSLPAIQTTELKPTEDIIAYAFSLGESLG